MLSSIALALVALSTAWAGGWPLAAVWLGAGAFVASEWLAMTGVRPNTPLLAIAILGLAVVEIALILGSGLWIGVAAFLAIVALLAVASGGRDRVWSLAGFVYAGAVVLVPVALRGLPGYGFAALLWMFAVVWSTDVAAYFTGRAVGGAKLWPAVSPGKTWSGFAGGVAGATLAGAAVALVAGRSGIRLPIGLAAVAALSCLASVASQAGDLAESAMKRRFGVKDSGSLIPGHGGFMDRLDGFAAVAVLLGLALAGMGTGSQPAAP